MLLNDFRRHWTCGNRVLLCKSWRYRAAALYHPPWMCFGNIIIRKFEIAVLPITCVADNHYLQQQQLFLHSYENICVTNGPELGDAPGISLVIKLVDVRTYKCLGLPLTHSVGDSGVFDKVCVRCEDTTLGRKNTGFKT